MHTPTFWRSVNLTGNQTDRFADPEQGTFWRSVNLTGNQTNLRYERDRRRFGAVSI